MRPFCAPVALFILIGLPACREAAAPAATPSATTPRTARLAAVESLHPELRLADERIQLAYRFAAANPDIVKQMPCFCGCGALGHTSVHSCFVARETEDAVEWEPHGAGCSICVDIVLDALRLTEEGQDVGAVRDYISRTFARRGPSNQP